eukprot:Gb_20782 [translate_table: standard]
MNKWIRYFDQNKQCCYFASAHNKNYVKKLLVQVEAQLKEAISKQPTLLVMVVGIPNVGKSALINSVHQIARTRFPAQEKVKRATVGPLPGVTQDIAGFKIAHRPSIYVLDTPGVLVPNIPDVETGLKLALTGAIKDSVVGEERLAEYLLGMLNTRSAPLHWKDLDNEVSEDPASFYLEDQMSFVSVEDKKKQKKGRPHISDHTQDHAVLEVHKALFRTFSAFEGNLENEDDLESLIETQFTALQKALRIPPNSGEVGRNKVARKILNLFRIGKLGHYTLDMVPRSALST